MRWYIDLYKVERQQHHGGRGRPHQFYGYHQDPPRRFRVEKKRKESKKAKKLAFEKAEGLVS
jgi:hypothetical protein